VGIRCIAAGDRDDLRWSASRWTSAVESAFLVNTTASGARSMDLEIGRALHR
jgi:hypothetical protein